MILTRRECQIARVLIHTGTTNAQIAKHLNLSPETVKAHMSNLRNKTGKHTRLALMLYILRTPELLEQVRGI